MRREFTGWHMAVILVIGFGIVVAVNFYMAALATRGFGGVVVENSYVASQKFNGWLEEAREQDELGWTAEISRDSEGKLRVAVADAPGDISVSAQLRRPLGRAATTDLTLRSVDGSTFTSDEPVPPGRWIARVFMRSANDRWTQEMRLE